MRSLGVEIRAGLHTGEIQFTESDVEGIVAHLSAQAMANAEVSGIVVSSTIKDLVAGSEIQFTDRRAHEIKGIPGKW
jgi:class 3 adenylate cyclase